ncbi:MAG: ABC transporter ATP-binding protein [Bacillota bacterium]|nr:ABC transporter ATP-binding protein [Bacillota bacterium]
MSILVTRDVKKNYCRAGREFQAVAGVDFHLEKGEFVHIIGRSGSGKSTFLSLLSGMLRPTSGQVLFKGEDLAAKSDREISTYRNVSIGVIPQFVSTMPNLSVLENIILPKMFQSKRKEDVQMATERARILMEKLEISHLERQFPRELSGGEVRRVMIARAMINAPEVLLADEPTSDLDKKSGVEVMQQFKKLNDEGVSLVVVTHELDVLSFGSRTLEMEEGLFIR